MRIKELLKEKRLTQQELADKMKMCIRDSKRTGLINQVFIGPVLMQSRVKRGNRIVSKMCIRDRDILVDVGHANQWLVQFLYSLGGQFDGELVTGEYGLSGGGDVLSLIHICNNVSRLPELS